MEIIYLTHFPGSINLGFLETFGEEVGGRVSRIHKIIFKAGAGRMYSASSLVLSFHGFRKGKEKRLIFTVVLMFAKYFTFVILFILFDQGG